MVTCAKCQTFIIRLCCMDVLLLSLHGLLLHAWIPAQLSPIQFNTIISNPVIVMLTQKSHFVKGLRMFCKHTAGKTLPD